ncbi:unnamed protein product [Cladocopium goreaui]|uniref:Bardet-Biedl syndrome 1 protein homolog n=1 Tax=Cladocopium goreaui TaxID=2562237 RepID=A0A9P1GSZ2_9DINO|nr:unnamed protein product [Cladocopium goreaui]
MELGFGDLLDEFFAADPEGNDLHPATKEAVPRLQAGLPRGRHPALGRLQHRLQPRPATSPTRTRASTPPPELEVPSEMVAGMAMVGSQVLPLREMPEVVAPTAAMNRALRALSQRAVEELEMPPVGMYAWQSDTESSESGSASDPDSEVDTDSVTSDGPTEAVDETLRLPSPYIFASGQDRTEERSQERNEPRREQPHVSRLGEANSMAEVPAGSKVEAPKAKDAEPEKKKSPWLDAWHDPVAGMSCYSSFLCLADLVADGDHRLVMVDMKKRIRMYKGTTIQWEHKLPDVPCAVQAFYHEVGNPPIPTLAVASGHRVLIFRNMRPSMQYRLPPIEIDPVESQIWEEMGQDSSDIQAGFERLNTARENGVALSNLSIDFLAVEELEAQTEYIRAHKEYLHEQQTSITCTEVLKQNMDEPTAVSMLVIGTENRMIYILDSNALNLAAKVKLEAVPTFISVLGLFDVEYRITVACRDGNIYTVKNGQVLSNVIELETQPVGLVRFDKNVYVGCMDNAFFSVLRYVNLLGTGHGPMSSSGGAQVRINAQVLGMGPQFKILVRIQNAGSTSLNDVPVHCTTNPNLYRIPKPCFFLPILVPQQVYLLEVPVACINENGGTASVRIFLASQHSHVPLISAVVQMPISEPPLLDF